MSKSNTWRLKRDDSGMVQPTRHTVAKLIEANGGAARVVRLIQSYGFSTTLDRVKLYADRNTCTYRMMQILYIAVTNLKTDNKATYPNASDYHIVLRDSKSRRPIGCLVLNAGIDMVLTKKDPHDIFEIEPLSGEAYKTLDSLPSDVYEPVTAGGQQDAQEMTDEELKKERDYYAPDLYGR